MKPKVKICGMRDEENIRQLLELEPDYLGFIFFPKSPRYVGDQLSPAQLNAFPSTTKKVGVFVNAEIEEIKTAIQTFGLDMVQLHGTESPKVCQELKALVQVIKVFSVGESFDFHQLEPFNPVVDFFLFDTKGKDPGGNGVRFDWSLLKEYDNTVPIFLSGGIGPEHLDQIQELEGLNIEAIDVNSCFELEPALKDVKLIEKSIYEKLMKS